MECLLWVFWMILTMLQGPHIVLSQTSLPTWPVHICPEVISLSLEPVDLFQEQFELDAIAVLHEHGGHEGPGRDDHMCLLLTDQFVCQLLHQVLLWVLEVVDIPARMEIYLNLGLLSAKYSHKTLHSSPSWASYGVSSVSSKVDLYLALESKSLKFWKLMYH